MTDTEKYVLVKNAVANVARGSSSAILALLLPPFLTRLMSSEAYGTWSLVLQISAYVGYLDFGLQSAVGRFVAYAGEKKDEDQRDAILSTSLGVLLIASLVGILGISAGAIALPHLFKQMPGALLPQARWALVLVGSSLAIGLPASVFNGVFVGLQRYEIPAAIVGGSRLLSAVLLVLIAKSGGDLVRLAAAMSAVNLGSYVLQYLMYRQFAPRMHISQSLVSLRAARELFNYCSSLGIWTFAMLLVTGLDVLLVGYFQFEAVAYYAVAATLVTFLAGLQNAIFTVMIPSSAVRHARGSSRELGEIMITATRYGSFLLLCTGLPLLLATRAIMKVWVGSDYALHGAGVLRILVAANMLRLSAIPYVMSLIGSGEHRLVAVTPLLEGSTNLIVSIAAGIWFGAAGVAFGTLIGSLAAVAGNLGYNMRRTVGVEFRISDYVRDGLMRPLVCAMPVIAIVAVVEWSGLNAPLTRMLSFVCATFATVVLVWNYGLVDLERDKLRLLHLTPQA